MIPLTPSSTNYGSFGLEDFGLRLGTYTELIKQLPREVKSQRDREREIDGIVFCILMSLVMISSILLLA